MQLVTAHLGCHECGNFLGSFRNLYVTDECVFFPDQLASPSVFLLR